MKTYVINLFGGPGISKSTTMARIFSELKIRGYSVEMAQEFAKELVWSKSFYELSNQIYVFANQLHRVKMLDMQVQFIVCDSPLPLSLIYDPDDNKLFHKLVMREFDKFNNINIILERENNFYEENGRIHSLEESIQIDSRIEELLKDHGVNFGIYSPLDFDKIVEYVFELGYNNELESYVTCKTSS